MTSSAKPDPVNILMVDDQPSKLLSYEVMLEELGENLLKAPSGRDALELLLRTEVAVVLMDVSMPELDGFQLAEMIREHPRFQKTAIIFISAVHLTDLDRLKGYQRGGVDYLSVPVVPALLRAKVSVFAELHRKANQLERLNKELRRLSYSLMTAQDEERRRIARELHDGLGQDLTAAKMMLDGLQHPQQSPESRQRAAGEALSLITGAIEQVRTMSHLLHPPLLDEMGLPTALRSYINGFATRSGLKTVFEVTPNLPQFEPELEMAIFKVVQESLTNVFKHAEASRVVVHVAECDGCALVSIVDNGKGLGGASKPLELSGYGMGMIGMRHRVEEYGGQLLLRDTGSGTLVEARIPIRNLQAQGASSLPPRIYARPTQSQH
jgi:signal transduction histidine kinase